MSGTRTRLRTVVSHLVAEEIPAKGGASVRPPSPTLDPTLTPTVRREHNTKEGAQAPGKKAAGDHASNQSVSVRSVTDEQLFEMDTKGWILLPGILSESECEAIKAHVYAGGDGWSGPAQE